MGIKTAFLIEVVRFIIKVFFHFLISISKVFRLPTEGITRAFLKVNNFLVRKEKKHFENKELLLLLPRCLQKRDCQVDLASDIRNCQRCGRCPVAEIVALVERYRIPAFVVDGGELARKRVKESHCEAIVAVACERELEEGILDVLPPVIGIINERPKGPCNETLVSVDKVEEAIKLFLRPLKEDPIPQPLSSTKGEGSFILTKGDTNGREGKRGNK